MNTIEQRKAEMLPYYGQPDRYAVAGGLCCAATKNCGPVWTFFGGPAYASPNFIRREYLFAEIDGIAHMLDFDMHRLRGCGAFCGTGVFEGCEVLLTDFAPFGKPYIVRQLLVQNLSGRPHKIRFLAYVQPLRGGMSTVGGRFLEIDTPQGAPLATWNEPADLTDWHKRSALVGFAGAAACSDGLPCTEKVALGAGESTSCALYHYAFFEKPDDTGALFARTPEETAQEFDLLCGAWGQWLAKGAHNRLPDADLRAVCEGMLVTLKMCQSEDGGFMACPRVYPCSYLRDTHGALRGLAAAGYTEELRGFILRIHRLFTVSGHIPNSAVTGCPTGEMNLNLSEEHLVSEGGAYYVLLCRYYYERTRDLALLRTAEASIRFAVTEQVRWFEHNSGYLRFNGDETERYVPNVDGNMYAGMPVVEYMTELEADPYRPAGDDFIPEWKSENFSFASVTGMLASVGFFCTFLRALQKDDEALEWERRLDALTRQTESHFLRPDGTHWWSVFEDGGKPACCVVNYLLMTRWFGVSLPGGSADRDIRMVQGLVDPASGFLPIAPGVNGGMTGHTLAYLLYDLADLHDPRAGAVWHTIRTRLLGGWGDLSEFYGPKGTPNSHNMNIFSTGITLDALLRYAQSGEARPEN